MLNDGEEKAWIHVGQAEKKIPMEVIVGINDWCVIDTATPVAA